MAGETSVWEKSAPLNRSGSPRVFASGHEKQTPKLSFAGLRPLPKSGSGLASSVGLFLGNGFEREPSRGEEPIPLSPADRRFEAPRRWRLPRMLPPIYGRQLLR